MNPRRLHQSIRLALLTALLAAASACQTSGKDPISAALSSFMPPTPGEAARDAGNPFDADARRTGISLLQAAPFGGGKPYLELYRYKVTDEDATVRAAAVRGLGLHGEVKDADLLIPLLEDKSDSVRWESAKALQKIHQPKAVTSLLKHLRPQDETNLDVRMACAVALGQYAEPRVFEALVGALNDTDYGVIKSARNSLHTLTGYDFGSDSTLWLIWQKKQGEDLFKHRQAYTWKPFEKPPSTFDKIQFWKEKPPVQSRPPVGLEQATRAE